MHWKLSETYMHDCLTWRQFIILKLKHMRRTTGGGCAFWNKGIEKFAKSHKNLMASCTGVFTIGPLGPCSPLWTAKKSRVWQNAIKMPHFQAKISKIFWGGGTAPSPDPTPTAEGNTPDQIPHLRRRSPRPLQFFFTNFYHYARLSTNLGNRIVG